MCQAVGDSPLGNTVQDSLLLDKAHKCFFDIIKKCLTIRVIRVMLYFRKEVAMNFREAHRLAMER